MSLLLRPEILGLFANTLIVGDKYSHDNGKYSKIN